LHIGFYIFNNEFNILLFGIFLACSLAMMPTRRANWRLGAVPEKWEALTTNGQREVEL
jgi:hypothetical protein